MTKLRKRMIESLQLRGLSERTQEAYVRAVRQLAFDHYHKSPDLISEEELRQYFLYIKNVKKYARACSTIRVEERVGGALGASGKWGSSVQVSGALRVSSGDQQQPHSEA